MLLDLNVSNPLVLIVDVLILLFIFAGVYSGFKKGFLESSIRLIGFIAAIIGAYLLKNPLSVFMYTHLPFFKFKGLFKGVSALNILVYEVIAFVLVFIVLIIAIKLIAKITGIVERLLSLIFFLGIPSKILGALVGLVQSLVILYFAIFFVKFGCNVFNLQMEESLADTIVNVPVLKEVFGDLLNSFDEITLMACDYEDTKNKEEFNDRAINVLLKYKVITRENLQILIDNGKVSYGNDYNDNEPLIE